ncbi:hypothetical protein CBS101457_000730 [Exobasidium rhododendri]|nr:hypothetical protein CBS101457_000730 [Exobasidium rhododendri]
MSFARKGANPPLSRNNTHQATGGVGSSSSSSSNSTSSTNNGAGNRTLSRPTSKNSLHTAYGGGGSATASSFSVSTTDEPTSSGSSNRAAPASPTKERMRQMGLRADGVGGNHLKQKGDEETNIQVVVRIRGTAPGEPPAHQPILSTSGPHCSSIKVAMETPVVSSSSTRTAAAATSVQSSLVNDASAIREKTYNFDHVFAPEADQGMVYQSVVVPVLNEVLSGYNCTIFAYGQTGTGKTHTMEGDLTESMGTYSAEAGVIPRTLYRLFHTLELSRDEYSVHASFVELYNEELRDLLSNDTPQPLGGGSNSSGLRMYEDSKGRGVVIQGLEDTPMKDAKHGLKLLQKGSQKRQIAATKCNESSSRSHSIFSLTVHIKETTSKGEDVLRTGKLNLVDLAGSENIGRSGAENKRAREAGMINQSLLTLGRVINALVEKSSHVPYRESKLTRLLQESLGGRTKTCIIATVSSERSNMEETLSTLDYALRAKSIRNRPEVNQQMTRAALIKEYVNEIERLKGDLLATREKNGIYISPENWQTMTGEHEGVKSQVEDLRRSGEVVESKMLSLKEQFEQNMQLLIKREAETKSVKAECREKEDEMQRMLVKMDELKKAEVEEKLLREAYMRSERKLHLVASELRGVIQESTGDVVGLFDKLDRKSRIDKKNRDAIAECQATLTSMNNQLEARVGEFSSTHDQFTLDVSSQLQEFQQREEDKLRSNRLYVQQKMEELQVLMKQSGEDQKLNKKCIDGLVEDVRRESEALISAAEDRNIELRQVCQKLSVRIVASNKEALSTVRQNMEEMAETYLTSLKVTKDQLTQDRKALEELQSITQEALQKELNKASEQNTRLQALLEEEKEKSSVMREKLVKNIGQMLMNFTQERQDSLQTAFTDIQDGNTVSESRVQAHCEVHSARMEGILESNRSSRESVKERERMAKGQKQKSEAGMNQGSAQLDGDLQALTTEVCTGSQGALQDLQQTLKDVHGHSCKIREMSESMRNSQEKQLSRVRASAEEGYSSIDFELQSTLEDVQETCEGVVEGLQDYSTHGSTFLKETGSQLSLLRETSRNYLSTKMVADTPTGSTPQKREYPSSSWTWSLVPVSKKKALRHEAKRKLFSNGEDNVASNGGLSETMTYTDESDSNQEEGGSECGEEDAMHCDMVPSDTDEGPADQTFTKARMAAATAAASASTTTTSHTRRIERPSTLIQPVPLRESAIHTNRLSTARNGPYSTKIRQPSGLTQTGSVAKKARQ